MPFWVNVTETVSVTVTPAVKNVQVPVHEPLMFTTTGVGAAGDPQETLPTRMVPTRIAVSP